MCGCRELTGERVVNEVRATLDFVYLIYLKIK